MVGLSGSTQALKAYRDTLQQSSIGEGERAHKLIVLYSAKITQPMRSPLRKEVLTKALTRLTSFNQLLFKLFYLTMQVISIETTGVSCL